MILQALLQAMVMHCLKVCLRDAYVMPFTFTFTYIVNPEIFVFPVV